MVLNVIHVQAVLLAILASVSMGITCHLELALLVVTIVINVQVQQSAQEEDALQDIIRKQRTLVQHVRTLIVLIVLLALVQLVLHACQDIG